jgi:hypothetical protein
MNPAREKVTDILHLGPVKAEQLVGVFVEREEKPAWVEPRLAAALSDVAGRPAALFGGPGKRGIVYPQQFDGVVVRAGVGGDPHARGDRHGWQVGQRTSHLQQLTHCGQAQLRGHRPGRLTMLYGNAWRIRVNVVGDRFEELRQLCTAAGDRASLAIAMTGLVADRVYQARVREASQLASEAMALIESLGDPTLTLGLAPLALYAKLLSAEYSDVLRWSQRVFDLADGDPSKGNFLFGSPLAIALTTRAIARYWLGRPGWRDDLWQSLAMARSADPMSYATVVTFAYSVKIPNGVLRPDDSAVREIEAALRIAERSADDLAVAFTPLTLGRALVHRQAAAERDRGQKLLAEVVDVFLRQGHNPGELPNINAYLARERARRGDRDGAIPLMRAALDDLVREGQLLASGVPATAVLVETLLDRGTDGDVAEAKAAIERLAAAPTDEGLVLRDIWLLRLRALLARAQGDEAAYRDYRDRYRAMARTLGFEGHMKWAEAMP